MSFDKFKFLPSLPLQIYGAAINSVKKFDKSERFFFQENKSRYRCYQSDRSSVEKIILPVDMGEKVYRKTLDFGNERYFEGDNLRLSKIEIEGRKGNSERLHDNLVFYFFPVKGDFFYGTLFDTFEGSTILSVGKGRFSSGRLFSSSISEYKLANIEDGKRYSLEDLKLNEKSRVPQILKNMGQFMVGIESFDFFIEELFNKS